MGTLVSLRDWGDVCDYVEMQWLVLQRDQPDDFVIAMGRQESVRNFIDLAAKELGWGGANGDVSVIWEGGGLEEVGKGTDAGEVIVRIDPRYFRPAEVETLLGDPTKAKTMLG